MTNATQTATTGREIQSATRSASANALASHDLPDGIPASARSTAGLLPVQDIESKPAADFATGRTGNERSSHRQRLLWAVGVFVSLGLLAYIGSSYLAYARTWVKTDNAYLATHIHSVSSRVAGTIQKIMVDENQSVAAGTVLARLDRRDFEVHRQQALAQVAQAGAQFQEVSARITQAQAQVALEQARATKANNDLTRAGSLYEGGSGAISKQEFDLARADSEAAEAAVLGARSALDSATASAAAAKAQEKVANASLDDAELQLSYTEIVAPAEGRIGKKNLEIGNRVQVGQVLLALVQTEVWVNANFKETQLTRLKPGQAARVRVDAFPGQTFEATVQSLAPGSGAQFALLPPDNATGNFTKIVQRVPVKIVLDQASLGECSGRLVAGMSAVVEVKVND
jgi:membrane fusion protein (multidrug efflux system)